MSADAHIAAVIFDFDGVLADTERLHLAAFQDAFEPKGWPLEAATYFDHYMGFDDAGLIDAYSSDRGLPLDEEERRALLGSKTAAFRHHLGRGEVLYPGVIECLDRLARRYKLAVASGALRSEIEDILSTAGVRGRFGAIVGADDVNLRKPAPEPYLAAAEKIGADPRRCLAIEDSRWGLESARAAGMLTIGITTTCAAAALVLAHQVVDHLDEVTVEAIEQLASRSQPW